MYYPVPKKRGRPPATKPRSVVSVKLTSEILDWIDAQAEKSGKPRSTWLAHVIQNLYNNNKSRT